jgi:hypothetical protein
MKKLTHITALTAAAGMLAIPATVLVAVPAHADTERYGSCGTGSYEFNVDREGNGFEVGVSLEHVAVGSKWKVVLKHDGKRIANVTRSADHEGDLDVDRYRPNTSGKDAFTMKATRVDGAGACSSKISVR